MPSIGSTLTSHGLTVDKCVRSLPSAGDIFIRQPSAHTPYPAVYAVPLRLGFLNGHALQLQVLNVHFGLTTISSVEPHHRWALPTGRALRESEIDDVLGVSSESEFDSLRGNRAAD
jgi:hypothetical protein